ncbi:Uncharacterised protein [Mycobacteroides abscessus subsp. abscessus]|nr:Uncharacterised protein [Mycobacteroides abscessus subsp. abscessus]
MSLKLLRLSPQGDQAIIAHDDASLFHYRGLGAGITTYESVPYGTHVEWPAHDLTFATFPAFAEWLGKFVNGG